LGKSLALGQVWELGVNKLSPVLGTELGGGEKKNHHTKDMKLDKYARYLVNRALGIGDRRKFQAHPTMNSTEENGT